MTVWHNPRCSKSRGALEILDRAGVAYQVRRYLDDPPSVAELEALLDKLAHEPRQMMRTNEALYRELGLDETSADRATLIRAMAEHPRLIERPILICGTRAVVGRPSDRIATFLQELD
ncbi:MAG: arsenate reductase (glutaredoxin) [Myxococcales bacterium]|nr:arsenate reductase (glutaredoxin) [Myxococcales bacterium]